jgi:membrane protease YdiL (CAAX protease family)
MRFDKGFQARQPAPWLYLFGVIAWTWAFWGMAAFTGQGLLEFPTLLLYAAGGLGPMIVAGILIRLGYWDSELDRSAGDFFRRSFKPHSLLGRWYLGIIGLVLILAFAPIILQPSVLQEQGLIDLGPGLFLLVGLLGALEEPGWRGYAQEGLQRQMPVIIASLVISVFWAAWHLPLFLIPGTYQAGLGLGTPAFWAFNLAILAGCPLYAWLYNATGRVIFAPVLYHALGNLAREIAPDVSDLAKVSVEATMTFVITLVAWQLMSQRIPSNA